MSKEEIKKYFEEHYEKKNRKRGRGINLPERLYRDFHKICIDRGKSMSEEVRLMVTEYIMEGGL